VLTLSRAWAPALAALLASAGCTVSDGAAAGSAAAACTRTIAVSGELWYDAPDAPGVDLPLDATHVDAPPYTIDVWSDRIELARSGATILVVRYGTHLVGTPFSLDEAETADASYCAMSDERLTVDRGHEIQTTQTGDVLSCVDRSGARANALHEPLAGTMSRDDGTLATSPRGTTVAVSVHVPPRPGARVALDVQVAETCPPQ
jgi:hypothetical protein